MLFLFYLKGAYFLTAHPPLSLFGTLCICLSLCLCVYLYAFFYFSLSDCLSAAVLWTVCPCYYLIVAESGGASAQYNGRQKKSHQNQINLKHVVVVYNVNIVAMVHGLLAAFYALQGAEFLKNFQTVFFFKTTLALPYPGLEQWQVLHITG